jgi:protein-S-isoprenylcysteine O-methyltransferase Ste14
MSALSTIAGTNGNPPRRAGVPRWVFIALGLFVWLVALPLAHGVLPWALSLLTTRHGWAEGHPALWNLLGLIPVAAGTAVLVWDLAAGLARVPKLPERVEVLTPPYLMTGGPYAFSRNPMYVAELALWLGWTILFGSVAVLVGFVVLGVAVRGVVPWEERGLEARFGEAYRGYKATVPRWLGRARR